MAWIHSRKCLKAGKFISKRPNRAHRGEDVVLVFRRVLGPANGAGGVPDPGFEGFRRRIFGHEMEWSAGNFEGLHLEGIKGLRKEVKKPEKTLGQGQGI